MPFASRVSSLSAVRGPMNFASWTTLVRWTSRRKPPQPKHPAKIVLTGVTRWQGSQVTVLHPALTPNGGPRPNHSRTHPGWRVNHSPDEGRWIETEGQMHFLRDIGSGLMFDLTDSSNRATVHVLHWDGRAPAAGGFPCSRPGALQRHSRQRRQVGCRRPCAPPPWIRSALSPRMLSARRPPLFLMPPHPRPE